MLFAFDIVDSVDKPAFVVPASLNTDDYFETRKDKQYKVQFTMVNISFLFRDQWTSINNADCKLTMTDFDSAKTQLQKKNRLDKLVIKKHRKAKEVIEYDDEYEENEADEDQENDEQDEEELEENLRNDEDLEVLDRAIEDRD